MRVIAGSAKKRHIKAPRGWTGRPTSDRVKEALFNILGEIIQDSAFLDIFAGTGNVGIEALSRGAGPVVFIEKHPRALEAIRDNLNITKLGGGSVLAGDCLDMLALLHKQEKKFDIVFLDPPYGLGLEEIVIGEIDGLKLLRENGLLVAESSKRNILPENIKGFKKMRQEKYGDTLLSFFRQY